MSAVALPRLSVRGPLRQALSETALGRLPGEALSSFLLDRRWFGGKGSPPLRVRFRDSIPLFAGATALTRLEVDPDGPHAATYQLPLAVRAGEPVGPAAPGAVLARVESAEGPGFLFDAVEDPAFRHELAGALTSGGWFSGRSSSWVVEPLERRAEALPEPRLCGVEQSNTSIAFGERAILKLYRRLATGENPDVEIAEFLAHHRRFANVPRLLATIRFHDADDSTTVAGMLQEFVPNRGDGWAYALERARAETAAGQTVAASESFAVAAARLGEITRELHETLAADLGDPEFAPLPVGAEDLAAWGEQVAAQVKITGEALAAKAAGGGLASGVRSLVIDCLARLPEALARVRGLAASVGESGGRKIRHHGDYHLGQVLVTRSGDFVILDFEGEPTRPLAERRQRHSALRDVAGMLRSFSYAAASAARESGASGPVRERLARWEAAARAAFLSSYLGGKLPAFLPPTAEGTQRLLTLFEIEKAFYEIAYEVNHRPDWVEIPLRGALGRLDAGRPVPFVRPGRSVGAPGWTNEKGEP